MEGISRTDERTYTSGRVPQYIDSKLHRIQSEQLGKIPQRPKSQVIRTIDIGNPIYIYFLSDAPVLLCSIFQRFPTIIF